MHQLTFRQTYRYEEGAGIQIPVGLYINGYQKKLLANIDSGASFCIFEREHGESMGLEIENGARIRVASVTGSFLVYGHDVALSVLGIELDTTVYFAAPLGFGRNVLGREGFLRRFRFGLIDYDSRLYLSDYDDLPE
ncbi:MAG: hypothetical protein ACRD44_09790 [Bryobacteraceae bacterium]